MKHGIVHSTSAVTLVGGGDAPVSDVQAALSLAPTCVAADGGLGLALEAGAMPVAVIGDFDSVLPEHLAQLPPEARHEIVEQDSTDFEKALRNIAAPAVLAVGFLGARLDHQMAAMHVLATHAHRHCILLGAAEVVFHCPPRVTLPLTAGDVVSLFPMQAVRGRSEGLRWPIGGIDFGPFTRIGTSNRAEGPVELEMENPGMLAVVPRLHLAAVMLALGSVPTDARWPVP